MAQPHLRRNHSELHLIERIIREAEEEKLLATWNKKESIMTRNLLEISEKTIYSRKNIDWKTESTSLYLIKINGNDITVEEDPIEEMEYEEAASENIRNEAVTIDRLKTL
ncbi:hypothetical protein B9Z55_015465 [Caenorhabditis nigoni]|uniref:Uncharacterized protein n=1 Tax=Caenorhabditis nigoni TaxID=1611254 RepID=A0A2G5UAF7_9PELO|nr:hypothetical protein B9Z55_015465 [Caenorhabditis nigoni]